MAFHILHYFQLIRLPNIFTVPSNILAGYFTMQLGLAGQLPWLVLSSILLYISGIVFNDYFDLEHDRKNRPDRPLPSGTVSRRNALAIAIATMVMANTVAVFAVGFTAFYVTVAISAIILAYDIFLKSVRVAGTVAISASRAINVVLGASPAIVVLVQLSPDGLGSNAGFQKLVVAAMAMFFYIVCIMVLSRTEERGASKMCSLASMIGVMTIIASLAIIGNLLGWDLWFNLMLGIFATVIILSFSLYRLSGAESTQKTIRNMVLAIILLDSVIITASAGIVLGLMTSLLLAPAIILGKRMYVT